MTFQIQCKNFRIKLKLKKKKLVILNETSLELISYDFSRTIVQFLISYSGKL